MEALDIGSARQALGNLLPILTVEALDGLGQLLVLVPGPVALVGSVLVLRGACLVDVGVLLLAADDLGLGLIVELLPLG